MGKKQRPILCYLVRSNASGKLPKTHQRKKMSDLPNFPAWNRETLDRFAHDAYIKLQKQAEIIEKLKADLLKLLKQME